MGAGLLMVPVFVLLILGCLISFAFFTISLLFLKWVSSGYLITLGFTHGGIVDIGWNLTRNFANLGFVLVLVFIAIATILRLESYGLKKLLPKFLIIILLINFSPVICGVIIDVANIVTDSFLNFDITDSFLNIFNPFEDELGEFLALYHNPNFGDAIEIIKGWVTFDNMLKNLLNCLLIIFFGIFSSFVFGLYFILFLLRYIAIWLLVILAPIAWFFWILPFTKKYWGMWWNYFLQWAFVGAIAGFFLKLGSKMISAISFESVPPVVCSGGCWQQDVVGIFGFFFASINEIFVFLAILIFLIIGFIISIKTAGGGAEILMNWTQKKASGVVAKTAKRRLLGPIAGKIGRQLSATAKWGERLEGKTGRIGKPFAKAIKWGARVPVPNLIEYSAEQRKTLLPKGWKEGDMSNPEKIAYAEAQPTDLDKLTLAGIMYEEGSYQHPAAADFREKTRKIRDNNVGNDLYKKEVGDLFSAEPDTITKELKIKYEPEMNRAEMKEKIEKMEENLKKILTGDEIIDEAAKKFGVAKGAITPKMKSKYIEDTAAGAVHVDEISRKKTGKIVKGSAGSVATSLGMTLGGTQGKLQEILDIHGRKTVDNILNGVGGLNKILEGKSKDDQIKTLKIVQKENEAYLKYFFVNTVGRQFDLTARKLLRDKHETEINLDPDARIAYEIFATGIKPKPKEKIRRGRK
ncbi:hypothetical protein ACFL0A_00110 [Patescibacteria group bacterium]